MLLKDYLELCIAFSSLIISLLLAVYQLNINYQQKIINENVINTEKQALLTVRIFDFEKCWKIIITNIGKGRAENIKVKFNKHKLEEDNIFIIASENEIEFSILNYGESFDILFFTEETHGESIELKIVWDDIRKSISKDYFLQVSESMPFGSQSKGTFPFP